MLFCAGAAAAAAFIGGGQTPSIGLGMIALIVLTLLISMCVDGFAALCVGLAAAAAAVFLFRLNDVWGSDHFFTVLVAAVTMLVLCWVGGQLGTALRELARGRFQAGVGEAGLAPVVGSLGLLTRGSAVVRLQEEIERAQGSGTALSLWVVDLRVTDKRMDAGSALRLKRGVARLVESLSRSSDVPFMVSETALGVILPGTDTTAAWDIVGPIMDAATRSTFADRSRGDRRRLSDHAELHSGLVSFDPSHATADALLEAATDAAAPPSYERSGGR
ncbi:hypothetical protein PZ938_01070 [Luteipulveratus sp. YIM 133132]|uniref:GGDEF domain-containing protein n=1 Tax=Luteipulveratus flavus TaxID=3031728 RepID=A0ABT6C9D5_9MICO|nr:hypothetical protein [Luteipulveratus sp. YIM 133296]MDE9364186.1 hypothetical protein [Luteipulveratus sp. YIM 133132]MDF8264947.1 hypothetical protein [Luteipulveratus sp. YIM 133296]